MHRYVLFAHLPFDFTLPLPVDLGNGVQVASSAPVLEVLDEPLRILLQPELAAGLGQIHVCVRARITRGEANAYRRLWRALSAVYLSSHLHWRATGVCTFDEMAHRVLDSSLVRAETVRPSREAALSAAEWERIRAIHRRVCRVSERRLLRIRSALTLWGQVGCGLCTSWQLGMIGLIATMECCFPQPGNRNYDNLTYGSRLASRVRRFLGPYGFDQSHRRRLLRIYNTYRNAIAHGVHEPALHGVSARRKGDFEFLLATSRLVLLGMLGFDNTVLANVLPERAGSNAAQRALDAIGSAPSAFLRGAALWEPLAA